MMVADNSLYNECCMSLGTLLADYCDVPLPHEALVVTGISLDSREVKPGDLFFACHGSQHSGQNYIQQAIKYGASAILYEEPYSLPESVRPVPHIPIHDLKEKLGLIADRFYGSPSRPLNVIGVTGTNGKSSCSHFIAHTLSKGCPTPCGLMGTLGNGVYGNLNASLNTTPDAVSVHRLLHEIGDKGAKDLVMEVSSHGLQQGRVNSVKFNTAVFTNLTHEHLDYHGSMEAYLEAKLRLFKEFNIESAVVNMADPSAKQILACLDKNVSVVGYRLDELDPVKREEVVASTIRMIEAVPIKSSAFGIAAKISSPWGKGVLRSNLLGRFNVENLLATLGVLLLNGVSLDEALARLETVRALTGRMEPFQRQKGELLVVVDYAHTPDALSQALSALRSASRGSLWCVFGCGGDRDKEKRSKMGEIAESLSDNLIITNDNPRYEDPQKIIGDVTSRLHAEITVIQDRAMAIKFAIENAAANDIVLIAGKGHETYQELGGNRTYFSDRDEVIKNLGIRMDLP